MSNDDHNAVLADLGAHVAAWPVAVSIADPTIKDCPVVVANTAFCDLTGYEREEIEGRNCRFLQGPLTDKMDVAELAEAVAQHASFQTCLLNYKKSGERFNNFLTVHPIDLAGGRSVLLGCQFSFHLGTTSNVLDDHTARLSDLIGKSDNVVPSPRTAILIDSAKAQSGAVAARVLRYISRQSRARA